MVAQYPDNIYIERETANLAGITYDSLDKKQLYSEDFQRHAEEIIAIETALGEQPQGAYETVKAWLLALVSAIGGKQDSLGFTPEDSANKSTDGTMVDNSDIKYPSQLASKTYSDSKISKTIAREIYLMTVKTALAFTDVLLIEDSGALYAKKKTRLTDIFLFFKNSFFNGYLIGEAFLQFFSPVFNPADSSTYYFGASLITPVATDPMSYSSIVFTGITGYIDRLDWKIIRRGAVPTQELGSLYLRVNTTDYLISNSIKIGYLASTGGTVGYLGIPVNYGDSIAFKLVTPAWVSNPTNVYFQANCCITDKPDVE